MQMMIETWQGNGIMLKTVRDGKLLTLNVQAQYLSLLKPYIFPERKLAHF